MKWTIYTLKRRIFYLVRYKVSVIRVKPVSKNCAASSVYENGKYKLVIDTLHEPLIQATIHELLHWLLDDYYIKYVAYEIYEQWIVKTAGEILENINHRGEDGKWRQAIERKIKG